MGAKSGLAVKIRSFRLHWTHPEGMKPALEFRINNYVAVTATDR